MADRFFRLVTFILHICTPVLKEYLIKCAKDDTSITYTTLDAYMLARKSVVENGRGIKRYQIRAMYPHSLSFSDSHLDISLLAALLFALFPTQLSDKVKHSITTIRDIRNTLHHRWDTTDLREWDFDNKWKELRDASLCLATEAGGVTLEREIKEKIVELPASSLPSLGETLIEWFHVRITELQNTFDDLKSTADRIQDDTSTIRSIVEKRTTITTSSEGAEVQNSSVKMLKENFQLARDKMLNGVTLSDWPEVEAIKAMMKKKHKVFICGNYLPLCLHVAMTAIEQNGYDLFKCAEIREKRHWRDIKSGNNDIELVLCWCPFGEDQYDKERSKKMFEQFDNMQRTVNKSFSIIIISATDVVDKRPKDHNLFKGCRVDIPVPNLICTNKYRHNDSAVLDTIGEEYTIETNCAVLDTSSEEYTIGTNCASTASSSQLLPLKLERYVHDGSGSDRKNHPLYSGLAFLSDNRLVAIDSVNKTCQIFNEDLREVCQAFKFEHAVYGVCALPDDNIAVTSGSAHTIYILCVCKAKLLINKPKLSILKTLNVHSNYFSVSAMPDNQLAVSTYGPSDCPVKVVTLDGKENYFKDSQFPIKTHKLGTNMCTYCPSSDALVLTDTFDHSVQIYNRQSGTILTVRDDRIREPRGVSFGGEDCVFVCSEKTDSIVQIDLKDGHVINSDKLVDMRLPCTICVSKDGKKIAVSNCSQNFKDKSIHVYSIGQ